MDDLVALLRARGKSQSSAAGILVERTTQYVMLVRLPVDHSAGLMRDALVGAVRRPCQRISSAP